MRGRLDVVWCGLVFVGVVRLGGERWEEGHGEASMQGEEGAGIGCHAHAYLLLCGRWAVWRPSVTAAGGWRAARPCALRRQAAESGKKFSRG